MPHHQDYETFRLNALKELEILDSQRERRFDRITRLAKLHFRVGGALLNFIDARRLWCKSCCGIHLDEIDRDAAICDHTVRGDDALVVEDLAADPRFVGNALVTGENSLRFYAGYPVRERSGFKVGAICLVDTQPRQFSDADRATLKLLAEMVEQELAADHRKHQTDSGVDTAALNQAIVRAQNVFLSTESNHAAFKVLLEDLLDFTDSRFGLIGELLQRPDGRPYLQMRAITNIAWSAETEAMYNQGDGEGIVFDNLDNMLGETVRTGGIVVSDDLPLDPRSGGSPAGHPPIRSYLGVPVVSGTSILGMIGLANREQGYTEAFGRALEPLCRTVGVLIERQRLHRERSQTQELIERAANYDNLTQLPNRRLLNTLLDTELAAAESRGGRLSVCFIDLDGFKAINDRHGHLVGDAVLAHIARRLARIVREHDIVARLSGDEFVAILRDVESEDVYQRMLDTLARPISHDGRLLRLSASMGITLFPLDQSDRDILIRHADQAMYAAKEAGRNCYRMFDLAMHQTRQQRQQILDELRQGLQSQQLELYLQPKIRLWNRVIEGFEALIRWHHPERGLLMPDQFLPAMDNLEDEAWLGEYVLGQAIIILQTFEAGGMDYRLSINISPRHFLADSFIPTLTKQLMPCSEAVRNNLVLEVVESAAIDDVNKAIETIQAAKSIGVSFALDDFGTGFSSLSYFRRLPVDEIKIDKSFVMEMLSNPDDRRIVASIINMARGFGRTLVAEGIESEALAQDLIRLGCDTGQGYHYLKPAPLSLALDWALQWQASNQPRLPEQVSGKPT